MGRKIEMDLGFPSLIKYAEAALEREDALTCAINLNEALDKAVTNAEKNRVYNLFVECYRLSSSVFSIMQAIVEEIKTRVDEEFYRFDFSFKKKGYDEEEPDYLSVRMNNDVKYLIAERRYDEAMALFLKSKPNAEQCEALIDALNDAVDIDRKFNIDKYILEIIAIMSVSTSKAEVLRLMLSGGKIAGSMVKDSVPYLIEEDDSNTLCLMGMAFYECGEYEIANKFFKKTLTIDPIDEDALNYSAIIERSFAKDGQKEENVNIDYFGRLKEVYRITKPPIKLTEEFLNSRFVAELAPYRGLPAVFMESKMHEIMLELNPKEDVTPILAEKISDFIKLSPEQAGSIFLDLIGGIERRPVLAETYKELLSLSRVPEGLKEKLYALLVDGGYEGNLVVVTDDRAVCVRIAKIHRRVHRIWNVIYRIVVKNTPFTDIYLPLKCGVLADIIKELDEKIYPDEDDVEFCLAVLLLNYVKRININVDYASIMKEFRIETEDIEYGMRKFGFDDIFIK